MKTLVTLVLLTMLPVSWAKGPDISGMSAEEAGRALFDYAEDYHAGWKSSISKATLRMVDNSWNVTERALEIYALEHKGNNDNARSLIIYDDDGTGLLTYMSRDKPDAQWVWVPGLKKKFRIQTENMTGAFIGSEFSYEDFRTQYPEKFAVKLLREEACDDYQCWVLERIPTKRITNYSRQEVYLDQQHFRVIRTDFYDKNERFLKTLRAVEWDKRPEGFWRQMTTEVTNHQTGRVSWLMYDDIQLDTGLSSLRKYLR